MAKGNEVAQRDNLIVQGLSEGLSFKEIAGQLDLTESAIRYHARRPEIAARLMDDTRVDIQAFAPQVLKVFEKMFLDEKTPAAVRKDIGLALWDKAGIKAPDSQGVRKPLSEMSQAEIEDELAEINKEQEKRGKLVVVNKKKGPEGP